MQATEHIRARSRSARERSRNLCITSQQLRNSLENLRADAAENNGAPTGARCTSRCTEAEQPLPALPTRIDFAAMLIAQVQRARDVAKELRRRAADLRRQAATSRASSQGRRQQLRGS